MASLGLLPPGRLPESLSSLVADLADGTLLAPVVAKALGIPVSGITPNPHTRVVARNNVVKVFSLLRARKDMSRRHLGDDAIDKLHNGSRITAALLLEDVRRACCGVPPRGVKVAPGETPFLGVDSPPPPLPTPVKRGSPTPPVDSAAAGMAVDLTQAVAALSRARALRSWMLGFKQLKAYDIMDGEEFFESLRDGVAFCELVQALERVEISGFERKPKVASAGCPVLTCRQSRAQSLHNVRMAMEVLRKNKAVPPAYLWSENEFVDGNSTVIAGLLDQLRAAYKCALPYVHSPPHPRRRSVWKGTQIPRKKPA